jgi:hypothetical protein
MRQCFTFYIFFQITIYSDVSLADGWTFYKRTNWASRKNIKYGLGGFSLYHLNWSIVNTDQESTYECKCFADDPGKKKYERSEKKETRCDINLFRSYHIISTRFF